MNEPSGIELERQNMQKQLKEMMSDVQIKQKKRSKERSSLIDQEKVASQVFRDVRNFLFTISKGDHDVNHNYAYIFLSMHYC